ncbi:helix-turn-helix domain-containing protein [Promicromonospora soli]
MSDSERDHEREAGTMGRTVTMRWNLRQIMATKGMFKTSDLDGPLRERGVELSRSMIHKVVTGTPQRINVELLAALCDILDCTPNDLLELQVEQARQPRAASGGTTGIGDLRPVRATVRRPEGQ